MAKKHHFPCKPCCKPVLGCPKYCCSPGRPWLQCHPINWSVTIPPLQNKRGNEYTIICDGATGDGSFSQCCDADPVHNLAGGAPNRRMRLFSCSDCEQTKTVVCKYGSVTTQEGSANGVRSACDAADGPIWQTRWYEPSLNEISGALENICNYVFCHPAGFRGNDPDFAFGLEGCLLPGCCPERGPDGSLCGSGNSRIDPTTSACAPAGPTPFNNQACGVFNMLSTNIVGEWLWQNSANVWYWPHPNRAIRQVQIGVSLGLASQLVQYSGHSAVTISPQCNVVFSDPAPTCAIAFAGWTDWLDYPLDCTQARGVLIDHFAPQIDGADAVYKPFGPFVPMSHGSYSIVEEITSCACVLPSGPFSVLIQGCPYPGCGRGDL